VTRAPKADDIPEAEVLAAIKADAARMTAERQTAWMLPATLWGVQAILAKWPPKVVLAKLRAMMRRGVIDGCGCRCRGDFKVLDAGLARPAPGSVKPPTVTVVVRHDPNFDPDASVRALINAIFPHPDALTARERPLAEGLTDETDGTEREVDEA